MTLTDTVSDKFEITSASDPAKLDPADTGTVAGTTSVSGNTVTANVTEYTNGTPMVVEIEVQLADGSAGFAGDGDDWLDTNVADSATFSATQTMVNSATGVQTSTRQVSFSDGSTAIKVASPKLYKKSGITVNLGDAAAKAVQKKVTTSVTGKGVPDKSFTFTVAGVDDASKTTLPSGTTSITGTASVTSANKDGDTVAASFTDSLTFTETGTYYYYVKETADTSNTRWTYDVGGQNSFNSGSGVLLTVSVPELDASKVTVTPVTFENKYTVTSIDPSDPDGDGDTSDAWGFKTIQAGESASELPATATFEFTLEGKDDKSKAALADGKTMTGTATVGKDKTTASVAWQKGGKLAFDAAGTYTFVVKETVPEGTGSWDYDEDAAAGKEVVVRVSQALGGSFNIESVTGAEVAGFTNTYTKQNDSAEIESLDDVDGDPSTKDPAAVKVAKAASDSALPDEATEFSFSIAAKNGTYADGTAVAAKDMPAATAATSGKASVSSSTTSASVSGFGGMTFDKAGDYIYTVTETAGGDASWACAGDGEVTIHVESDGTKLVASLKDGKSAEVTNTYTQPTKADVDSTSIGEAGASLATKAVAAGTSSPTYVADIPEQAFDIQAILKSSPTGSNPTIGSQTATVTVSGAEGKQTAAASFGEMSFDKEGAYVYTVSERPLSPADPVWSCDSDTHDVTIEVTKNADNQLVAEVKGGQGAIILNTYTKTVKDLTVTKVWNDSNSSSRPSADDFVKALTVTDVVSGTTYTVANGGLTTGTAGTTGSKPYKVNVTQSGNAWTVKVEGLPSSGEYKVTEGTLSGYKAAAYQNL